MSTALAKRAPESPKESWKSALAHPKTIQQLGQLLKGTGWPPEKYQAQAYMAVVRNEKLLGPPRELLWLGVFGAAEMGLSLHPQMQQMHLVPFNGKQKKIEPIIGYQGFQWLIAQGSAGLLGTPQVVYTRDLELGRFKYRGGTGGYCYLEGPPPMNRPRGRVEYVFTVYQSASGKEDYCLLTREELLEAREHSSGWQAFKVGQRSDSPWKEYLTQDGSEGGSFVAMCAKTVTRRHAKQVPKSATHWGERLAKATAVDEAVEGSGEYATLLDSASVREAEMSAGESLAERMGAGSSPPEFSEEEKAAILANERKEIGEDG